MKKTALLVIISLLFTFSYSCSDDNEETYDTTLNGTWEITSRIISSFNDEWPEDVKESFKKWDVTINGIYQKHGAENDLKYAFNDSQNEVTSTTTLKSNGTVVKDLKESYTLIDNDSIVVISKGLGEITRQGKYKFSGNNTCIITYHVDGSSIRPFLEEISVDPQIPNGAYPYKATIRYYCTRKN